MYRVCVLCECVCTETASVTIRSMTCWQCVVARRCINNGTCHGRQIYSTAYNSFSAKLQSVLAWHHFFLRIYQSWLKYLRFFMVHLSSWALFAVCTLCSVQSSVFIPTHHKFTCNIQARSSRLASVHCFCFVCERLMSSVACSMRPTSITHDHTNVRLACSSSRNFLGPGPWKVSTVERQKI